MNIMMCTNTYLPHVGGVAHSVHAFAEHYRALGHQVLVIAPEGDGEADVEYDVVRVPAIQSFNDSDFSVPLVAPVRLVRALDDFSPDIVHSHHPFLLGATALRIAGARNVPIVFTHHTRYETYTHYLPIDSALVQRFVIELATRYCNLCDAVIAPSESIQTMLVEQGVIAPIDVIPTGVEVERFASGDCDQARHEFDIPDDAFVVGHVGRLAHEKNLEFLARALAEFLRRRPDAHFLVVGQGPEEQQIRDHFEHAGLSHRLHMAGTKRGQQLADCYTAMDVFAFSSHSETQGMVLAEAMAAGVPIVALDASGVRDVVKDGLNGRLLPDEDVDAFVTALDWVATRSFRQRLALQKAVAKTAEDYSMRRCAMDALELYADVIAGGRRVSNRDASKPKALRWLDEEMKIISSVMGALGEAIKGG